MIPELLGSNSVSFVDRAAIGRAASELAEATDGVKAAFEAIVTAVFAGFADFEAAFGFGDACPPKLQRRRGGGVSSLSGELVSEACGCMGDMDG